MSAARQLDPANDMHYAMSEDDQYKLRLVAQASDAIGTLFAVADPDRFDPNEQDIAAIFNTIGFAISSIIGHTVIVMPRRQK